MDPLLVLVGNPFAIAAGMCMSEAGLRLHQRVRSRLPAPLQGSVGEDCFAYGAGALSASGVLVGLMALSNRAHRDQRGR